MKVIFLFLLLATNSFSSTVFEEKIYEQFKLSLLQHGNNEIQGFQLTTFEQKLLIDALEDLMSEEQSERITKKLSSIKSFSFNNVEKIRIEILRLETRSQNSIEKLALVELLNELKKPEIDKRLIYILAAHKNVLAKAGHWDILQLAKKHAGFNDFNVPSDDVTSDIVTDLFYNTPDVTSYMGGEYKKSVKIFMFCRRNRLYPCLMVMKDINGNEVRMNDGSIWTNPSLASARTGFPSHQRNGNTPAGIFTIDSVMPVADQQLSYGKFRRMILNFIPSSEDEKLIKSLLPPSSWSHSWWKPTLMARDIGRNLFRIHGSGKINDDPAATYFPFMQTLGCIAQRENTYNGTTYKDQRALLDTIMINMDLIPMYDNEPSVKGILYVLELNDKNSAVSMNDLKEYGIR